MKKIALLILITAGLSLPLGTPANAHENRDNQRPAYGLFGGRSLQWDINHLNRMVGHVRWELGRYHANRSLWREFADIRNDVARLNERFRHGNYDRRELRRQIERQHARLHELEQRVHHRNSDYYQWR